MKNKIRKVEEPKTYKLKKLSIFMNNKKLIIGISALVILVIIVLFLLINKGSPTGKVILDDSLKGDPEKVTIYFFWREGCPHCSNQKPYLEEWENKYSEIEVISFDIWEEDKNLKIFQDIASLYGIQARGVPITFIGEKNWIGFSSQMAEEMEEYIKYCIENNNYESPVEEYFKNNF